LSVVVAVVERAVAAAVVLHGEATGGVRGDVVDLASFGGDVAGGVDAGAVPDLDGASGGTDEHALACADVEHPGGPVEQGPFQVGEVEEGRTSPGVTMVPLDSSQIRSRVLAPTVTVSRVRACLAETHRKSTYRV
jgi:hypothetical protein